MQALRRGPGGAGFQAFLIFLAASAFVVLLIETSRYGLGISPDSLGYLQLARELGEPGGLAGVFGEQPSAAQPPLLPIVLALIEHATGLDPFVSLRYLNALLYALCVYLPAAFFVARAARPHLLVAGSLSYLVFFSPTLQSVSVRAWTEPLFIFWTLLCLMSLSGYLISGTRRPLLLATLGAILAVYTRYSGVTLIATGALLVVFASQRPLRRRVEDLLLFGGLASAAFAVWVARNLAYTGTLLAAHPPSLYSMTDNLALSLAVFGEQLLPVPHGLSVLSKLGLAAALGAAALWAYLPQAGFFRRSFEEQREALLPWLVFAGVYWAFMVVTATVMAYDPLDVRLLSPLFVPLLVGAAFFWNAALRCAQTPGPGRRRLLPVTLLLVALPLISTTSQFARGFRSHYRNGSGFNSRSWSESKLLRFLEGWDGLQPGKPVFSNAPAVLGWHLGISARESPIRFPCGPVRAAGARQCFEQAVDPVFFDAYLVYFRRQKYPYFYTLEELEELAELAPIDVNRDGGVYRVSRPH